MTDEMPKSSSAARPTSASPTDALSARIVAATADVALVIDTAGTILDVQLGRTMGDHPEWRTLVGQKWLDVVMKDSRGKVEQILAESFDAGTERSREVNIRVPQLGEFPLRFTGVNVDAERMIALGTDLRPVAEMQQRLVSAQQGMELEYRRLRQADTRYRVLFHVCAEGVVVVDGESKRVLEANPAAARLLGEATEALAGQTLLELFDDQSRDQVVALLAATDAGAQITVELSPRGRTEATLAAEASSFRQAGSTVVLLRLQPTAAMAETSPRRSRLLAALEAMPDGFVVIGEDQSILCANLAFCELVQRATEDQVIGQPLDRWLGRPGVDMKIITANLREYGVVNAFSTVVRADFGPAQPATVTAVAALDGQLPCYGFTIRQARASAVVDDPPQSLPLPRSPAQLRELVGRVSLKEIVRESSDLIEKLCIETALDVSSNNRAAAAQLLGLSRQGLYSKLKRHGLDDN